MPSDLVKLHNISVVPMHVIMGDKSYKDGSIEVTEVYYYSCWVFIQTILYVPKFNYCFRGNGQCLPC
ncbi:hypothetical protein [Clostridium sp.]|uniref:hypothetical protein n=1 Tax=Clostridium sp. TaxID=1506 RepID=UPI003F4BFF45